MGTFAVNIFNMEMNDFKILLVDDEQDVLEFMKYNLEKEGFWVYTATNGADGIQLAKKNKARPDRSRSDDAREGWHHYL